MNPVRFLWIVGIFLIISGVLGIGGILGSISDLGFFHPPHWINWAHFSIGAFALIIIFSHSKRFQAFVVLIPAVLATTIGILGLLLGQFAADRFNVPELSDPSDHIAHLILGLSAIWAWRNRNK